MAFDESACLLAHQDLSTVVFIDSSSECLPGGRAMGSAVAILEVWKSCKRREQATPL